MKKMKVLYVPLDDRDCNYHFPYMLSKMTEDMELIRPDFAWMGELKKPADRKKIWQWLFDHAKECEYAILSVDTLVYGNIIHSRIHHLSMEECKAGIENFRRLKELSPHLHIHAFNLVARVAAYDSAQEDPDYWENYGKKIWKYTWLLDKDAQGLSDPEERNEIRTLKAEIPQEHLKDFLERREIDREINLSSVELTREGIFDHLTIPKDDTAEFGYAAMDQAAVAKKVREYSLFHRVYIYPGADEVGSVLFTRIFNLIHGYQPIVYVRYASVNGARVIPRYEDRPLGESVKWQITSAGGIITETPYDSDCMLAVNAGGTTQIESTEQKHRSIAFKNNTNSEELLCYIRFYHEKYQRAIGVSDVTTCNGCDNDFMENARIHGIFDMIDAIGGWNTAENTNGVVIAQMMIASYYHRFENKEALKVTSDTFMARALVADWLAQSNVAHDFYFQYAPEHGINPFKLQEHLEEVKEFYKKRLSELLEKKLGSQLRGREIHLQKIRFSWNGAFYFAVDCELTGSAKEAGGAER